MINSLVAYKGKPARIGSQNTHKFELEFSDGSTRRVREKDFRFIHPEFIQVNDNCIHGDLAVLDELSEEILTLQEITLWLFGQYSTQNAWCACLLAEDGLYFYWQKNKIFIRPTEQVKSIQSKRDADILEAKLLQKCAENIAKNRLDKSDLAQLQAIEKVALNQSKHAKILTLIGVKNTPEAAYQLLLKMHYFEPSFNPYPARFGIPSDEDLTVKMAAIERVDLTHLTSFAIDNATSNDADDAISVQGNKLWVHIADVGCVVESGSELDLYAQARATNLYLPNQILHMLPMALTPLCALGLSETSAALSIGFVCSENEIQEIEVVHSTIKVTNMTYADADELMATDEYLLQLQVAANTHKQYRDNNHAISLNLPDVEVRLKDEKVTISVQNASPSRELVAEMMIMAGRAIAIFAINNKIIMPYAVQDEGDFPQEVLDNKDRLTLSESFKATRGFKRSATTTKPLLHFGLGLDAYLRITSPLRRYLDLLAHQQLSNFIAGKETLGKERVMQIISIINATMPDIGKTIRASNDHYKCLYLMQNPKWQGTGIVVDLRGDKVLLMIPELGMMTQIKFKTLPVLDEKVLLKIGKIDLATHSANFKPI